MWLAQAGPGVGVSCHGDHSAELHNARLASMTPFAYEKHHPMKIVRVRSHQPCLGKQLSGQAM